MVYKNSVGTFDIVFCGIKHSARGVCTAFISQWFVPERGMISFERRKDFMNRRKENMEEILSDYRIVCNWLRASKSPDAIFQRSIVNEIIAPKLKGWGK